MDSDLLSLFPFSVNLWRFDMAEYGSALFSRAIRFASGMLVLLTLSPLLPADQTGTSGGWVAKPARPYEPRGGVRRLVQRFEQYVEAEQWDDAISAALRLIETNDSSVVSFDEDRYSSVRVYVHRHLSKLPSTALARYRELVDATAADWYRQGVADRNVNLLRRLVDEMFCSTWGDDALLALGELELERGNYQAARLAWQQIHPAAIAVTRDFSADGELLRLVYPDSTLESSSLRARLILILLREGDLQQAAIEIAELEKKHPHAQGRLGGQQVAIAKHLAGLLQQARTWPSPATTNDWTTFAGSSQRRGSTNNAKSNSYELQWSTPIGDPNRFPLATFPITVGEQVIYQTSSAVHSRELATSTAVFSTMSEAFQSTAAQGISLGLTHFTLSAAHQRVFGITVHPKNYLLRDERTSNFGSMWGIDLNRDGALVFRKQLNDSTVAFAGAPVLDKSRVLVALRGHGRSARAGLACYNRMSQQLRWQRWICQSNSPPAIGEAEYVSLLPTYDSGILYICTNLGAIAAVRGDSGEFLWLRTYQRVGTLGVMGAPSTFYHRPSSCVYHRGLLLAIPTDSKELVALNASTGALQWSWSLSDPNAQIVGVSGSTLLLADKGWHLLKLHSGEVLTSNGALQLRGMAVIADGRVYWPTDSSILQIDLATGDSLAPPISLAEPGGANLLLSGDYLVAAGPSQLSVYRNQSVADAPKVSQNR